MMHNTKHLVKELRTFAKSISSEYPLQKMILFGSRAKGTAGRHSDVDLLLVSPSFHGQRPLGRSPPLYMRWNLKYPVDFLCYTPEEFERKKKMIGIVDIAIKEGIPII